MDKIIWESGNSLVGGLANSINDAIPGKVTDINKIVKDLGGRIVTDFDIELNDTVIQVKSGGGKGLTTQLNNTNTATTKGVVAHVPVAKPSIIKSATENEYNLFTNINKLFERKIKLYAIGNFN